MCACWSPLPASSTGWSSQLPVMCVLAVKTRGVPVSCHTYALVGSPALQPFTNGEPNTAHQHNAIFTLDAHCCPAARATKWMRSCFLALLRDIQAARCLQAGMCVTRCFRQPSAHILSGRPCRPARRSTPTGRTAKAVTVSISIVRSLQQALTTGSSETFTNIGSPLSRCLTSCADSGVS